ncbi:DNA alkylation repair protein [Maribacter sp. TH_r10]|uniref:DNA alkylation repair protein n=1 Tax=Maribacter sp. TH_r10 TaxID=3082086 RepID=UPI0029553743|nr:DNA alkylation repair protein [Maribacter sp. TH_r10]MDV7137979.1 DNA alkylation repair protein [Maribacter sp. TH_r10]
MNDFLQTLEIEFEANSNPQIAEGQKAYMRNHFEFYGITSPKRREIQRPFLVKSFLPPKEKLHELVKALWQKPQREYQFFAQELVSKYTKQFSISDISILEYMVTHKSWWDTVDYIAVKLIGPYFERYPEQLDTHLEKWLASDNIWLQRCCLLYQLKRKDNIDTTRLNMIIQRLLGSKEFFINKAIGWVLREYSRTNPNWVKEFVSRNELANLSRREAIRLMDR